MGRKCIIPGCKSSYDSSSEHVSLFGVPKDDELRAKWVSVIPTTKTSLFVIFPVSLFAIIKSACAYLIISPRIWHTCSANTVLHRERETAALYLSLSHTCPLHHSAASFGGQKKNKRLY